MAPHFRTMSMLCLGLYSAPKVEAKSCNTAGCKVNTTVSVSVVTLQRVTLSTTTTALGVPTINNLDSAANPVATTGPTVTGSANVPFSVRVSAASANFAAPAGVTKPATDLSWSLAVNGTYSALTTTGAAVIAQGGGVGATTSVTMFYHTAWHTSNAPGPYSLNIVFTLTEP